jgi:hypothetical protein
MMIRRLNGNFVKYTKIREIPIIPPSITEFGTKNNSIETAAKEAPINIIM